MDKKNLTTIIVVVVLVVLGFFGYRMWQGRSAGDSGSDAASLFTEAEVANPFKENSSNPYDNIKTNPFE